MNNKQGQGSNCGFAKQILRKFNKKIKVCERNKKQPVRILKVLNWRNLRIRLLRILHFISSHLQIFSSIKNN